MRKENSREDFRAKDWKREVNKRDNFTCYRCGKENLTGKNLHTHHIKPWKHFLELRFDALNGITLCRKCHTIAEHSLTSLILQYVKSIGLLEYLCDLAFQNLKEQDHI